MNQAAPVRSSGHLPVVGLLALDRDLVIEGDLHRILGDHVDLVTTRIRLREVGSLSALKSLTEELPTAIDLMGSASLSAIAFGCTSGVAAIGAESLRQNIGSVLTGVPVVDPLTRILDGLNELGAESVALVTPYQAEISRTLADWLSDRGLDILADVRIDTSGVSHYAQLTAHLIETAVEEAATFGADAVVVACTDLRVLELIESLERRVGVPVLSSNQALARAISDATETNVRGPGRLFSC